MKFLTGFLVLALTVIGLGVSPLGARNGSAVPVIDNNDRAQVAETYRSAVEANMLLNPTWNGDTSDCEAGGANETFDAATVESINWFRRMAGLNPVSESAGQSAAAQAAALMMHAQNNLSHFPGSSWSCHTAAGAAAAGLSNLTLGIVGPRGVVGQIEDPGAGNEALGHRRWLLFPELQHVGVGNTSHASVVQVINDFGARYSESQWVAWPPPGFVPDEMMFDRWSMSYSGASSVDFSNARVSVTENGVSLGVRLLPIANGYGDPALGWEVPEADPHAAGDVVYNVRVTGVLVGGRSTTHSYTVTSFDPSVVHMCGGHVATIVGTAGADTLRGTPERDVIVALGGNDTIESFGGSDVICAGSGNDSIRAGSGKDVVRGGSGHDTIHAGRGNDVVRGDAGQDRIDGGGGNDKLVGGGDLDTLVGNVGNDVCWGRATNQATASNDIRHCESGR